MNRDAGQHYANPEKIGASIYAVAAMIKHGAAEPSGGSDQYRACRCTDLRAKLFTIESKE